MTTLAAWLVLAVGMVIGLAIGIRLGRASDEVDGRAAAYRDGYAAGRVRGIATGRAERFDRQLDVALGLRRRVVPECEPFDIEAMWEEASQRERNA